MYHFYTTLHTVILSQSASWGCQSGAVVRSMFEINISALLHYITNHPIFSIELIMSKLTLSYQFNILKCFMQLRKLSQFLHEKSIWWKQGAAHPRLNGAFQSSWQHTGKTSARDRTQSWAANPLSLRGLSGTVCYFSVFWTKLLALSSDLQYS
jgi:hypothetical protein